MNQPRTETAEAEPQTQAVPATVQSDNAVAIPQQRKAQLMAGGAVQAIVPRTIEEAYRLAGAITAADMAPKSYKRDANAVMIGILHGMEVGFTPMAALQSIAVINGMPSIWGDGALSLIQASGLLEDMKEWNETDESGGLVYHCHMKRRGRATWIEQKFSWEDAKTAKLTGKDTYQQYGRRMLQRRARAWAMTDGFADVLRGLHIREALPGGELEEQEDGSYAPKATPARPVRSEPDAEEEVRAAGAEMDGAYRATMRETPAKPAAPTMSKAEAMKFGPQIKKAIVAATTIEDLATVSADHADAMAAIEHHLPILHGEIAEMIAGKKSHIEGKA